MISKDDIMTAKHVPMSEVLSSLGVFSKYKKYSCPFHDDSNPSAAITDNNLLWCFACGKGKNTIDVVMKVLNVGFPDAVGYLLELNHSVKVDTILITHKELANTSHDNYIDTLKSFRSWSARLKPSTKALLKEHLEGRKLYHAIEVLKANKYDIGVSPYGNTKQITYKLNDFFIKRGEDGQKYIMGNLKVTPLKVNSTKTFMIVEGITDALAATELGYNAISLNGIGNINLFKELLLEHGELCRYDYIIGTDNDSAGIDGRNELMDFFTKHNVNWKDYNELRENQDVKDIGELLIKTKERK